MNGLQRKLLVLATSLAGPATLLAQAPNLSSGEVTVQMVQGLNSAANPRGISQGNVTASTNPAIPVNSTAVVGIAVDAGSGGFTARVLQLRINGQPLRAASSAAILAPDRVSKVLEFGRKGPKDSASGAYVFLPERTIVRFTLAEPAAAVQASAPVLAPQRAAPVAAPQLPFVKWNEKIASPTTDDVKTACEAKDNTSQAFCYAALMSLYDSDLVAADNTGKPPKCIPEGTTPEQLRKAFLDYAAKRPTQTSGDIGIFFYLAVDEAFPCPKAPVPKHAPAKRKK